MSTRDFTYGAKLIPRPDGRFDIDIRGRVVPSPRNEGYTLFQAEIEFEALDTRKSADAETLSTPGFLARAMARLVRTLWRAASSHREQRRPRELLQ